MKKKETTTNPFDICNNPCAIDSSKPFKYDTHQGTAVYCIPVPKYGKLIKISQDATKVIYEVTNGDYESASISFDDQKIKNLSKKSGEHLTVIVDYKAMNCTGTSRVDKKKKSVIPGQPFLPGVRCTFI